MFFLYIQIAKKQKPKQISKIPAVFTPEVTYANFELRISSLVNESRIEIKFPC